MNKALAYYATWYYKQFEGESANVMAFMSSHIERIWTGWNHGREETWGSHGWQLRVFPAPAGPDMIIFERVIEVSVNRKLVGGHKRGPTNYVWRFRSVPLLVSQEFREVPKSTADLRRILGMHDLD
jgi:hypothetical protein